MYNYIISFFSNKNLYPFSKEFRRQYKKSWINNIKDYSP